MIARLESRGRASGLPVLVGECLPLAEGELAFVPIVAALRPVMLDPEVLAGLDLLTVLRPHLHQAYLDAERRRRPTTRLTARQRELLHMVAAGHTNAQNGRRLGISEGTVRTHLENIYRLLKVSSRTAAVTRAFADRTAWHW